METPEIPAVAFVLLAWVTEELKVMVCVLSLASSRVTVSVFKEAEAIVRVDDAAETVLLTELLNVIVCDVPPASWKISVFPFNVAAEVTICVSVLCAP